MTIRQAGEPDGTLGIIPQQCRLPRLVESLREEGLPVTRMCAYAHLMRGYPRAIHIQIMKNTVVGGPRSVPQHPSGKETGMIGTSVGTVPTLLQVMAEAIMMLVLALTTTHDLR